MEQQQMKKINPYKMFVGAFIPNFVLRRTELSDGAKLCYGRLSQYAGANGSAYPKIETIAKELGVSDRSAFRYIKELRNNGLITTINRSSSSMPSLYFFLDHPWMYGDHSVKRVDPEVPTNYEELSNLSDFDLKRLMDKVDLVDLVNSFSCALPPDNEVGEPMPQKDEPPDTEEETPVIQMASPKRSSLKEIQEENQEIFSAPTDPKDELRSSTASRAGDISNLFLRSEKKRKIALKEKKRNLDLPHTPDTETTAVVPSASLAARRDAVRASLGEATARATDAHKAKLERQESRVLEVMSKEGKLTEVELRVLYGVLEQSWSGLLATKYPDSFHPKFGPKERNICKQLLSVGYKTEIIQSTMQYLVMNWDNIKTRYFKSNPAGVVSLSALYGLHESLFREASLVAVHMKARNLYKDWIKNNPGSYNIPKNLQDRSKEAKTFLDNLGIKN